MPSVLSLQVGPVASLGPDQVPSAFVKRPVSGSVRAGPLGLEGDAQADLKVHGGTDKAVYVYPSEHYARWLADVPRHEPTLHPGAFGENVTTVGLEEEHVAIGDVWAIGSTQMQVSEPRQPCFKLGLRFGDNGLGRIMMQSGRSGWYMRVLRAGELKAGDEIHLLRRPNPNWTIARFNQFIPRRAAAVDDMRELMQIEGLAQGWREEIEKALGGLVEG
jgi:MOSC domain-containing protein YiiM